MFVPRPGADKEDDGIVLVTNLNGDTKQGYLLMLDGETFDLLLKHQKITLFRITV